MLSLYAILFGVSLFLTLPLVPLAAFLARRWGVLDHPGERKIHAEPIPLAGGWALFASFSLVVWGCLLGGWLLADRAPWLPDRILGFARHADVLIFKFLPVWGGALAMFLVGAIDDVKGLSARSRLLCQSVVGVGLAWCGLHPNLGFLPEPLPAVLGVLWVVGITNSFNLLDGLDGLSAGVALVGAGALLTIMGIAAQPDWGFLLAVICGALVGFLRWNWHPAKVFLGSAGSLLVGYLLAVATMMVTYKAGTENWLIPLLTPLFLVAIPLYDTLSVILIRLLQRRGIMVGDRSHFHHRLMRIGFSHRQTVAFVVLISFAIALSAVRLVTASFRQSLLILLQIVGIFAILILAERVANNVRKKMLDRRGLRERRVLEPADRN
jgi:UDP-GlcNAc:undecaprenyl-phosphate GlcNAc-1-phosphate transferase